MCSEKATPVLEDTTNSRYLNHSLTKQAKEHATTLSEGMAEQTSPPENDVLIHNELTVRLKSKLSDRHQHIISLQNDLQNVNNEIECLREDLHVTQDALRVDRKRLYKLEGHILFRLIKICSTIVTKIPGFQSLIKKRRDIKKHRSQIQQKKLIAESGQFDINYYIALNPVIKEKNIDPLDHFLTDGAEFGARPNPLFDPIFYSTKYPDVAFSEVNPFYHYLAYGQKEGRQSQATMPPPPENYRPKERYSSTQTILFVGHDASQTGAPKVLLELIRWFYAHTAFNIRIVLLEGGVWQEQFENYGQTLILSDFKKFPEEGVTQLLDSFAGDGIKLVYLNTVASASFLHFWQRTDIPLVAHIHEMQDSIDRLFKDEIRLLTQKKVNYIAVSPPVSDALIDSYGVDKRFVTTVFPFISNSENSESSATTQETSREALELPQDRFIVVGCGVIYHRKGVDLFLKCASEILQSNNRPKPLFVWVGGGYTHEDLPKMQQLAENLGVADDVLFVGAQTNPRMYFQASDVFLMTSREDPFPLVCLEAAERGKPVICFDKAGGMPLFVSEDAGFVVPYLDTTSMAEKVKQLQHDPETRKQLGQQAQQKIYEKYSVDTAAMEIMLYLRSIADLKPAVSVIVPNYNHARYLGERLDSIYQQTFKDIEVILLDDASTDNSTEILDQYQSSHDQYTFSIYNTSNSGSVFKQWKKGFSHVRSDIVWIAESDDVCSENFLARMLPQMNDAEVMLAFCQSYCMGSGKDNALTYTDIGYYDDLGRDRWLKDYWTIGREEITHYLAVKNTIPNVSSTLIRNTGISSIFSNLDKLKLSGDWLFYINQIEGGCISYLAQPLNYHRVHPQSVVNNNRNEILFSEFEQMHKKIGNRFNLSPLTKNAMINYVENIVYPTHGEPLQKSFDELYSSEKVHKSNPHGSFENKKDTKTSSDLKPIAFFLPQFHEIKENNMWWGDGFTEWKNTEKACCFFDGHDQPRIPHEDIGHYDLSDYKILQQQANLARHYGIHGFCFYHYWFDGVRLLQKPIELLVQHPEIDLPFCICWANENWTRCWDGLANEVLISQNHTPEDDIAFISDLSRYLKDPRYIMVDGKPLVIIYRPELLPDPEATAKRWRTWMEEHGFGNIYLAYIQGFSNPENPHSIGFDAKIEFPPLIPYAQHTIIANHILNEKFEGRVVSYPSYMKQILHQRKNKQINYPLYRSTMVKWDNTPRRSLEGTVFVDFSLEAYKEWLHDTVEHTKREFTENQQFFFINAWNEWAEGTYLEPDKRLGYAYLNTLSDVLQEYTHNHA